MEVLLDPRGKKRLPNVSIQTIAKSKYISKLCQSSNWMCSNSMPRDAKSELEHLCACLCEFGSISLVVAMHSKPIRPGLEAALARGNDRL